jgi:hypothetical protein
MNAAVTPWDDAVLAIPFPILTPAFVNLTHWEVDRLSEALIHPPQAPSQAFGIVRGLPGRSARNGLLHRKRSSDALV